MTTPDEYRVIYMPFPGDIYACVRVSPDGYPTIYINAYLSPEARKRALKHELHHLEAGDFYNHVSIYDAEANAIRAEGADTCFRACREPTGEEWATCAAAGALALHRLRGLGIGDLRKEKGLTIAELAAAVGLTAEQVAQWEAGTYAPGPDAIKKAAQLFAVPLKGWDYAAH